MCYSARYLHARAIILFSAFAEYEQIKAWLNYVDPSYRLRKLLDDRAEGTGSWFLDGDVFTALKEGKNKAVLLSGKGVSSCYSDVRELTYRQPAVGKAQSC